MRDSAILIPIGLLTVTSPVEATLLMRTIIMQIDLTHHGLKDRFNLFIDGDMGKLMAISIEQLHAFSETVEKGGFKQASRSIGKHAVTISGLVANLESEVGFELFVRKPRSLELTEKGNQLFEHARSVLRELEHFDAKASSLLEEEPSRITIAMDTALSGEELSQVYKQLFVRFPTLEVKILTGDALLVRSWVLTGQADIGFSVGTFSMPHELSSARAFSFQIANVASPDLGIAGKQLTKHQVRGLRQISVNFLKDLGLSEGHNISNKVTYCNSLHEILNLVKHCSCWAIMPLYLCREAIENGEVDKFELEVEDSAHWYTDVIWRTEKPVNSAMRLVIDGILKLEDR
ncbi:LysR family transcriptional regulator [Shewanella maritima]|uniref:LysR family transcriptional regulator n=1 Tax=Shewanella maritima TaxID=2520507 RepID=A0A411PHB1_9GAMM|nr:LysR family transcriptional regulator [Shewanella maritima]QBF82854.1 LysR family transcriptional regulator [Shewanella maritima]